MKISKKARSAAAIAGATLALGAVFTSAPNLTNYGNTPAEAATTVAKQYHNHGTSLTYLNVYGQYGCTGSPHLALINGAATPKNYNWYWYSWVQPAGYRATVYTGSGASQQFTKVSARTCHSTRGLPASHITVRLFK